MKYQILKILITTQKVLEIGKNQAIQNNLNIKYKYEVNSDETKKIIAPFIDVINNQQQDGGKYFGFWGPSLDRNPNQPNNNGQQKFKNI